MWVLLESKDVKLKAKEFASLSVEKNDTMLMKNNRGKRKLEMEIMAAMEKKVKRNSWGIQEKEMK